MFKKMSKIEKVTFIVTMLVVTFIVTCTNIPTLIRYKINEMITRTDTDNYYLNKNYVELAIHDDEGDIIDYWEAWVGNLGEDVDEYMSTYWVLAPKGVNEDNFVQLGYDQLVLNWTTYQETGRYVIGQK